MDKLEEVEDDDSVVAIENKAQSLLKLIGEYDISDDHFELITNSMADIIQDCIQLGADTITEAEEKNKNRSMRSKLYDAVAFSNVCSCGAIITTHQSIFVDGQCDSCLCDNLKNRGIRNINGLQQKQTY